MMDPDTKVETIEKIIDISFNDLESFEQGTTTNSNGQTTQCDSECDDMPLPQGNPDENDDCDSTFHSRENMDLERAFTSDNSYSASLGDPRSKGHYESEVFDSMSEIPPTELSDTSLRGDSRRSGHQTFTEMMQLHRNPSAKRWLDPVDMEAGRTVRRTSCAEIRDEDERSPQMRRRRLQDHAKHALRKSIIAMILPDTDDDRMQTPNDVDNQHANRNHPHHQLGGRDAEHSYRGSQCALRDEPQYRLFTVDSTLGKGGSMAVSTPAFVRQLMAGDDERGCGCLGLKPNRIVVSYLFWAFRSSFLALFLSAAVWFFMFTLGFAAMIYIAGRNKPECIHVGGYNFDEEGGPYFLDAYALSWTTFSTVGYGAVHPSTSANTDNARKCFFITVICTWESFVGILIASFWSAIFLSKVTRISSFAQVTFSSPILIQYGVGVGGGPAEDDDDPNGSSSSEDDLGAKDPLNLKATIDRSQLSRIPCPVLEFRILNRLHSLKKGEIIDASLSIAASVDASQVEHKVKNTGHKKHGRRKRKATNAGVIERKSLNHMGLPTRGDWNLAHSMVFRMLQEAEQNAYSPAGIDYTEFDGGTCFDSSTSLANRKVFARVMLESREHPFFQRIWTGRHILDHESPLLRPEVKKLILLNNGYWPEVLDSAAAVRASVKFDQILVSMSGTSNADCNSVYSQKLYSYEDLFVGYKFANMLYRDSDESLKVDEGLLNDVLEQTGGGGEDLFQRREREEKSAHSPIYLM